ncbi:uncharacterized protein LOC130997187 [Salvia miltiorrhiza]|uniref:uncharacterized protein LOC130997187 n=1 Tax=Salvia miltiorrhiza TaxID=226208 RepID=UPI0025ABEC53|nr:uncharacterized protein LOC130997187 [Salvia miltiorrhiza]
MASIRIHTSGKLLSRRPSFLPTNKPNQIFTMNTLLPTKKSPQQFPSASIAPSHHAIHPAHCEIEESIEPASDSSIKSDDPLGRIDSWLQDSVPDIVKNLKKAPLLVQIYSGFDGGIRIQTEKAKWPMARDEWRSGESKSPDGLIFVEELERERGGNGELEEGVTRAWGIVVQGKGAECGPACYLLKTDRVCAGLGLGFCTHFCLMKVNNFRDSALEQFKDSWLLQ